MRSSYKIVLGQDVGSNSNRLATMKRLLYYISELSLTVDITETQRRSAVLLLVAVVEAAPPPFMMLRGVWGNQETTMGYPVYTPL